MIWLPILRKKAVRKYFITMIPVYVSDSFDASALEQWTADGIYSIYCETRVIHYNDEKLTLKQLYQKDDLVYTAVLVGCKDNDSETTILRGVLA